MPVSKVRKKKSSHSKLVGIRKVGVSEIFWDIADYCGLLEVGRDKETLEKVFSFVALGWNACVQPEKYNEFMGNKEYSAEIKEQYLMASEAVAEYRKVFGIKDQRIVKDFEVKEDELGEIDLHVASFIRFK